jgi:hypothetical protein
MFIISLSGVVEQRHSYLGSTKRGQELVFQHLKHGFALPAFLLAPKARQCQTSESCLTIRRFLR